ncbi:MAG: hypothetical protein AAGP08_18590 [Pseudomonadota bacterium]
MRSVIAFFLSAVMLITSGAMAVARGNMLDAEGQIVLCTSHGTSLLLIDADGNPLGAPHICPDCNLSLIGADASPHAILASDVAFTVLVSPKAPTLAPTVHVSVVQARAPPV